MTETTFREVALPEILASREERAASQAEISARYKTPLVSFTMNIAGPRKNSPLIMRAFNFGIRLIYEKIPAQKILYSSVKPELNTGPCAIFAVSCDAVQLKEICVEIEERVSFGRLFDIDVIDESLTKLSRKNERGCIVCGASGRYCAAARVHNAEELQTVTERLLTEGLFEADSKKAAALATESLIKEVRTTPKPGLVDLNNNGSHKDLTPELFEKSAYALENYFSECFKIGRAEQKSPYDELFGKLRAAGLNAEKAMYEATDGVNTHKGAVFSFGILLGAIGRLWRADEPVKAESELSAEAGKIAAAAIADLSSPSGTTAGELMYINLGLFGIRGEAASGFSTVFKTSLPTYRELLAKKRSENEAGAVTLIHLISQTDDTAIYNRGGESGLFFAKNYARDILSDGNIPTLRDIEKMDVEFIKRNLSAGGAADLLALTYFIDGLKREFNR